MVRDNRVSLGFDEDEHKELSKRAKEAHLKLGDYIRWFLFRPIEAPRIYHQQPSTHQIIIPYKASAEVIERIKAGKEAYVDPYQEARLEAQSTFKESGGLGLLHNSIKMMAKGGKVLKQIPKKDLKNIVKQKEERKHVANKHLNGIKQKNIAAGFINNE